MHRIYDYAIYNEKCIGETLLASHPILKMDGLQGDMANGHTKNQKPHQVSIYMQD